MNVAQMHDPNTAKLKSDHFHFLLKSSAFRDIKNFVLEQTLQIQLGCVRQAMQMRSKMVIQLRMPNQ